MFSLSPSPQQSYDMKVASKMPMGLEVGREQCEKTGSKQNPFSGDGPSKGVLTLGRQLQSL